MNLFENLQLMKENSDDEFDYYNDFYDDGNSELVNKYKDMYDSEMRDLEEKLSFSEFCKKFDDHIKQSFDTITGEEDSYKKYPSSFNQHQTYAYDDYLNGTSYFEDEMLEESSTNNKYSFTGPVYRFEHVVDIIKEPIYTLAPSIDKAYTNFCYRLKSSLGLERFAKLTIDKKDIKIVEDEEDFEEDDFEEIDKSSNPVINDPKYNFEDPDREDEYVVEDFEVNDTEQEYTSAKTSINSGKLPAIFKMINLKPGTVNLDFGGGRFNNVAEYYKDKDITNLVYDPYNRSSKHNKEVIDKIRENGGADSCTLSNVLNVIKEPEARKICLQNCYNLLKSGGDMYVTVYEGDSSGQDRATSSGYQLNKKTNEYLAEIQEVFPNAKRKGKLIYATK